MKKILVVLVAAVVFFSTFAPQTLAYTVRGYSRNGRSVESYYRSRPNAYTYDNYSYRKPSASNGYGYNNSYYAPKKSYSSDWYKPSYSDSGWSYENSWSDRSSGRSSYWDW